MNRPSRRSLNTWWVLSLVTFCGWTEAFSPYRATSLIWNRHRPVSLLSKSSEQSAAEEAEKLRQQAQKLRDEIEAFQKAKDSLEEQERLTIQAELNGKQAWIDKYSVVVPILKPDGSTVDEKIQFPARFKGIDSTIMAIEGSLPLGLVLGEHETIPGMTTVDEVTDGSNGESAGFQVGDLIRACTACRVEMDQPMWQLMAGGIGRPKTVRFMFSTDFQPFEKVMDAIGSNRMDPEQRQVIVVVERSMENNDLR